VLTFGVHPQSVSDDLDEWSTGRTSSELGPVALEAELEDFPLDVLMAFIGARGHSGVLRVEGPRPAQLYFADGDLCGGETVDTPINRVALASGESPKYGDNRSLVEDHLLTALAAVLVSTDSLARFHLGAPEPVLGRFRFTLDGTLEAARERMEAWRAIADVLPSTQIVLQLSHDLPAGLDRVVIDRADWHIVSYVDGQRTVAEIITTSDRTAFDVCSALYRTIVQGVVDIP